MRNTDYFNIKTEEGPLFDHIRSQFVNSKSDGESIKFFGNEFYLSYNPEEVDKNGMVLVDIKGVIYIEGTLLTPYHACIGLWPLEDLSSI